jgi:hypothetical protein
MDSLAPQSRFCPPISFRVLVGSAPVTAPTMAPPEGRPKGYTRPTRSTSLGHHHGIALRDAAGPAAWFHWKGDLQAAGLTLTALFLRWSG